MAGKRTPGTLLKNNFEDATRAELESAHELKTGNTPSNSFTVEELRSVVQAIWGETHVQAPLTQAPPTPISAPKNKGIPNLGSSGVWEGRKRRVTLLKRDTKLDYSQPIGWNGSIWNVPVGVAVDMPWPYWESLQHTMTTDNGSDDVVEWVRKPGGRLEKHVTPITTPTIKYIDHGDVEGTEDLPTSYWDFYRREAMKNNCFEGKHRSVLITIHNTLKDPLPAAYFRDMRDIDIRIEIAQVLGTDIADSLQGQMYAEA